MFRAPRSLRRARPRLPSRRRTSASAVTNLARVAGRGRGSRDGRVARASRLAGHAPVMSRGMAAEWVCGRPRGADAREGVCRLDGVDKAFFRGNDENVRARGILEEYPIGLLSGSTSQALAASLFTKVETLCLRTFPHKSSSTSRSKRQAANRRFCACENRRGASAGTDLSPPPCRRPIETTHRPKLHTPPVTMSDYGSDVEDDSEHTLANVGFPRSVCFQACFVSHVGCGFQARSREARASFARPVPALNRSID